MTLYRDVRYKRKIGLDIHMEIGINNTPLIKLFNEAFWKKKRNVWAIANITINEQQS